MTVNHLEHDEPKADEWVRPRGVNLLTIFAKDVIAAGGNSRKLRKAVRHNLHISLGHAVHPEDRSPLRPRRAKR